jgi:SNF2 family DNA or RNA helicase
VEATQWVRLPSLPHLPLTSPELLRDTAGDGPAKPALALWEVTALRLEAATALTFLARLPEQRNPAPGVALGADLRYWREAGKFGLELLARQRFMPSLDPSPGRGGGRVGWEPVLEEASEAERFARLAAAMPPLCRAFVSPAGADVPARPAPAPPALLRHFLRTAVDSAARDWLAGGPRRGGRQPAPTPARWIADLRTGQGVLDAPEAEVRKLHEAVWAWTQPLRVREAEAAFRTCFRLEPPATDEADETEILAPRPTQEAWSLHFFLQATDDLSLLVPAERVWKESQRTLRFLNRRFEQPQERLLADLGRAARLFPPLERGLRTARPQHCALTTEQAYGFLRESAWLLEESGFGVLVPPWWSRGGAQGARIGVQVRLRSGKSAPTSGRGILGLNTLVEYDWQLALGDQPLAPEEFQQLASLKVPLVRLRGQWVELQPDQIEAAITFWEKQRAGQQMTLREALQLGLGGGEAALGLPVVGLQTDGWIAELTQRLGDGERLAELPAPQAFHGTLRPYQVRGFSWLTFLREWGLGACLADDMGLGKTIQLLALLLRDREQREAVGPTLLLCPMSVVGNWQREVARFAPSLRVHVHHGPQRLAGEEFAAVAAGQDLVLSTYALAHRDAETLTAVDWEGVVLDEAQNIKNPGTKQTQAIRGLSAGYRIALTGTPVENRLQELWSIMEFLNAGYLGSNADFRARFANPIERYQDADRAGRLRRLVQPFILRRLKTDPQVISDLPEKIEMNVFTPLTPEQATLYEAVVKDMMEQIAAAEGIQRRGLVLATLMKLKQLCNHPAHFLKDGSALPGRSGKLARLEEMLEEVLAEGDRALLFTQFAEMGELLKRYLQDTFGCEVLFLHGGVPKKARDQMVARFQEETEGPPLFLLSLKAGGIGLNLTRAHHVFHFDRWWNPAVENQATDRAFRIGQRRNVQVHKFVCQGTVEEQINDLIESKKALAEMVVSAGENWLTELSTAELRDLFALRKGAVAEE